ncbi:MAG: HAD family hydrolase [Erysipelotrichaceae bacterium]|nr:HAD family hydrolase [Erysipelotrichaceae bacterium]
MKKIFFFDIDGTLIDCNRGLIEISKGNQAAIKALQNKGHLVFIATGRTKCFIVDPIRQFPFDGFVVCNGGYIEYNQKCLSQKMMDLEAIKYLVSFCREHGFDYYLESYDTIYVNDLTSKRVLDFASRWEMKLETMCDQFDLEKIKVHIAMIVANSEEDFALIEQKLSLYFDVARHPHQLSFDINIKGVNKGTAILELIQRLNIELKDTYAFGDGLNDIEMIETVGHGIAMGNALEVLKEKADDVCEDVLNDGISKTLKRYKIID